MDIMPAFEAVVPGSNPGGCTSDRVSQLLGLRPGFEKLLLIFSGFFPEKMQKVY